MRSDINERLKSATPSSIEFLASAARALSKLKGTAHAELRLKCTADIALFLITQGYPADALSAINAVRSLSQQLHLGPWIRRGHLLAGLASADLGSTSEAIIWYSKAWEVARSMNDIPGQLSTLNNLGSALNYGALYREAIPYFELSLALSRSTPAELISNVWGTPREYECATLNNLAQSYLYLQEFDRGFDVISQCLRQSTEPDDARSATNRVLREHTFVLLALELGRLNEARLHTEICRRYSPAAGVRRRYLAEECFGLCEVYGGDTESGIRTMQRALDLVRISGIPAIVVPTLISIIRACEAAQMPELALDYMTQLVATIRAKRAANVSALLSCNFLGDSLNIGTDDLQPLMLTEARLRAKVAERKATSVQVEMLERLAVTADLREEESGEHGYRVGKLSALMANEFNWTRDAMQAIELAARLHDIGKIGVPDRILLKTQKLRDAEREMMSVHTLIGAELLAKSDIVQLRMAEDIARYHHEWWDGTGYPVKLSGKRIPIHARIVALADVFDALTHGRPYAPAWPIEKALEEIQARRGTQFDPELTDKFIELVRRLQSEHADLDEYLGRAGRNSPFAQARNRIRLMLEEGRERIDKQVAPASETLH